MAQSAVLTFAYVPVNNEIATSVKADHGQMAIEQLSIYIEDNIQIPASVEAYGFSGKMMLEVTIDSNGAIQKSEIVQSSHLKSMDKAVMKALSSLNRIDVGSVTYQGKKIIHIPLYFNIER